LLFLGSHYTKVTSPGAALQLPVQETPEGHGSFGSIGFCGRANAVLNVRFTASSVTQGAAKLLAYGTAMIPQRRSTKE